jgi:nucleoside-diphosphate-sugar epimerase
MRVLVTGSTGLIGNAVARLLVDRGHSVRALVRDPGRAARVLPDAVERVRGDIEEPASLPAALTGVEWVFHVAGMPEQWQPDDAIFERVNTRGTANVMAAALAAGVKRVVYTSTMDVFAAPPGGTLVETNVDPDPKGTPYERSKQAAEREVEAVRAQGLDVVYVNPGAVYGPSPVHVGVNSMFIQFLNGQLPMTPPGGMALAYVEGVAAAHVAAAERGRSGERYLIGDAHATNHALVSLIAREAGVTKVPGVAPAWLMKAVAAVSAPLARVLGFTPLIAPGQLAFLLWSPRIDASKAARELGFVPTALEDGVRKTLEFLRAEKLVPAASPRTA